MRIDPDVLTILRQQCTIKGMAVTMPQLDRKLYVRVNKALEMLGGKWNKSAKAHLFTKDPATLIGGAAESGQVVDKKKEFQYFPTPPELARKLITLADIEPAHLVLEPSAGTGAIVDEMRASGINLGNISVCELEKDNQAELKAKGYNLIGENFLNLDIEQHRFHRIVANPPFSGGQDIHHVNKMFAHLLPGGRIATIMSPGWTFRDDKKYVAFREWVETEGFYHEELPPGTFKDSGTEIRTTLLVLTRDGSAPPASLVQTPAVSIEVPRYELEHSTRGHRRANAWSAL